MSCPSFRKLLLVMAVLARANAANRVISNEQKPGSYDAAYSDGSSFIVEDVIEEGDFEFNEVGVPNETDDYLETLEFFQNLLETSKDLKYIENFEDVLFDTIMTHDVSLDQRDLVVELPSIQCDCISNEHYFNVEIMITPSSDSSLGSCDLTRQRRLGNHINNMLLDLGVGNAGIGDDVLFLAKVCNVPSTFRRRLSTEIENEMLKERELLTVKGFLYSAGGPCRGCYDDNLDRRKLATFKSILSGSGSTSTISGRISSTSGSTSGSTSSTSGSTSSTSGSTSSTSGSTSTTSGSTSTTSGSTSTTSGSSTSSGSIISGSLSMQTSTSGSTSSQNTTAQNCIDSSCTQVNTYCTASSTENCGCNLSFHDFLINLNQRITQYMTTIVVPANQVCCGKTPGIKVTSMSVSESDVNYGCKDPARL